MQLQQRLSAVWFGIQQAVVDEVTHDRGNNSGLVSVERDAILNTCGNNGCRMSSVNIFTLNG